MAQQNSQRSLLYWPRRLGASLFGIGFIPAAPGTLGSAATVGAIWYLSQRFPEQFSTNHHLLWWAGCIVLVAISIFLATDAKATFGKDDPGPIIIDEVAGQFITFFMVPLSMRTLIVGFFLFRFFDIIKPFPVHTMEDMEGGVGVTMDDVIAGVYANICLMLIITGYHWVRGYL